MARCRTSLRHRSAVSKGARYGYRHCKVLQFTKRFGFIQPDDGGKDVFVHISAVERAGMRSLNEGRKLRYDIVSERGTSSAANLQNV